MCLFLGPQQQRRERELRKQQEREQRRRYEEMEQLRREEERRHAEREQVLMHRHTLTDKTHSNTHTYRHNYINTYMYLCINEDKSCTVLACDKIWAFSMVIYPMCVTGYRHLVWLYIPCFFPWHCVNHFCHFPYGVISTEYNSKDHQ